MPNVLFKEITCVLNLQKKKLGKLQHGKNGWHMSVQLLVLFAMMMNRLSTISKKLSKHTTRKLKYYFHIKSHLHMKFPHTKISFQNGTGIYHQKSVCAVPIIPIKIKPKKYANLTEDNWQTIVSFLAGLKWKIHESELTSDMELTYAFWDAGCRLQNVDENPKAYSKSIRKCVNQALKAFPDCPLVPGCQIVKCKGWGRTLPSGCLKGCTPLLELSALKRLAFTVLQGRSHLLSNWDTPF